MTLVGDWFKPKEKKKKKLELVTPEGCGGQTLSAYSKRKWTN